MTSLVLVSDCLVYKLHVIMHHIELLPELRRRQFLSIHTYTFDLPCRSKKMNGYLGVTILNYPHNPFVIVSHHSLLPSYISIPVQT